jgi:hypothetical protein
VVATEVVANEVVATEVVATEVFVYSFGLVEPVIHSDTKLV